MHNRIDQLFARKKEPILSVYYTAGFPLLNDTLRIAAALEKSGVDMLEIGIPYSDPIADGPTIQQSSGEALKNGMTVTKLFQQLIRLREQISIPVLLMGYFNPIYQFGFESFCSEARNCGIDGLIIPDLPIAEYETKYKPMVTKNHLHGIFLVSPQTPEARIRQIERVSSGFIYLVSSAGVTGAKRGVSEMQLEYFQRIRSMGIKLPKLVGFGISNKEDFQKVGHFADGAIIGSAFIQQLQRETSEEAITSFIHSIKK